MAFSVSSRHVTTASAIPGWQVEEHLGLVAAHVVAGTGFVSDLFAGFSDLFGGRSESYRNQLASLYDDAIGQLLSQSSARGGNWLLGLRIDLDEVSGKGTQMFMITAIATAVRALPDAASPAGHSDGRPISGNELQVVRRRLELVHATETDTLQLTDPTWAFLIEHRVGEVAPIVLSKLGRWYSQGSDRNYVRKRAAAYFAAIPAKTALNALYAGLSGDANLRAAAQDFLQDLELVDLGELANCLRADDLDVRRAALQTLRFQQSSYGPGDLETITHLMAVVDGAFPTRAKAVEKKGLLGGHKHMWECICRKRNEMDKTNCEGCFRDQRGFQKSDFSPEEAKATLKLTANALTESLAVPPPNP